MYALQRATSSLTRKLGVLCVIFVTWLARQTFFLFVALTAFIFLACGFLLDVAAFCWLSAAAAAAVPSSAVIIAIKYNDDDNNKTRVQKEESVLCVLAGSSVFCTYSQYKRSVQFYVIFIDFLITQAFRGKNVVE
jgi:hypothetical protein